MIQIYGIFHEFLQKGVLKLYEILYKPWLLCEEWVEINEGHMKKGYEELENDWNSWDFSQIFCRKFNFNIYINI